MSDRKHIFVAAEKEHSFLRAFIENRPDVVLAGFHVNGRDTDAPLNWATSDNVDIVVECLHDKDAAHALIREALSHGKTVIARNIGALAASLSTYHALAEDKGGRLIYKEALWQGLAGATETQAEIRTMILIPGGVCAKVVRCMDEEGFSYDKAVDMVSEIENMRREDLLKETAGKALALRADVIRQALFPTAKPIEKHNPRGLEQLESCDVMLARKLGYVIRLSGFIDPDHVDVLPVLVSAQLPLAHTESYDSLWAGDAFGKDDILLMKPARRDSVIRAVMRDIDKALWVPPAPRVSSVVRRDVRSNPYQKPRKLYVRAGSGLSDRCRVHPSVSVLEETSTFSGHEAVIISTSLHKYDLDQALAMPEARFLNVTEELTCALL